MDGADERGREIINDGKRSECEVVRTGHEDCPEVK